MTATTFHWSCKHTWRRSAKNTAWCVLGCAIGDFGTILFREIQINENFDLADQFYEIHILSNYTLIGLIVLHISAVIVHKLFFGDNLLKRIL